MHYKNLIITVGTDDACVARQVRAQWYFCRALYQENIISVSEFNQINNFMPTDRRGRRSLQPRTNIFIKIIKSLAQKEQVKHLLFAV